MTRNNVTQRLALAVKAASQVHPDLAERSISPHTIRHYLPFLTMSCNVSASTGTTGVY
jgi:hypothetical protein